MASSAAVSGGDRSTGARGGRDDDGRRRGGRTRRPVLSRFYHGRNSIRPFTRCLLPVRGDSDDPGAAGPPRPASGLRPRRPTPAPSKAMLDDRIRRAGGRGVLSRTKPARGSACSACSAEEMGDAQVAAGRGPVDERQARAAVRPGHAVAHVRHHHEALEAADDEHREPEREGPTGSRRASGGVSRRSSAEHRGRRDVLTTIIAPIARRPRHRTRSDC